MIKPGAQNTDVRIYFLGQFIKALKKTGVTSKYHRRKGGMNKFELRKKRRLNGSEDEILKNNYQLGS